MIRYLKSLFHKPTPLEMAMKELILAEHAKLEAETGKEYAETTVAYNTARIKRLTKYINDATKEDSK